MLSSLTGANQPIRRSLLYRLHKLKRQPVIDAFLRQLAAQENQSELVVLLAFGSAQLVVEYLPALEQAGDNQDWARLAKAHPVLIAGILSQKAASLTQPDYRLLDQVNGALPALASRSPMRL